MASYAKHVSRKTTSQSEPIPGSKQVPNSAGGYSFEVDCWAKLDRFLILGNEGGSYYAGEREMTLKNVKAIDECVALDHDRVVNRIVEISEAGRAPRNDPAVFALAYLVGTKGPVAAYALDNLNRVCRIGTHLFQFAETVHGMRGWGRAVRRAIASWYTSKKPRDLAYQLVKYQQRNGWSHKDLLRISHLSNNNSAPLRWAIGADIDNREVKRLRKGDKEPYRVDAYGETDNQLGEPIEAFEKAKKATTAKEIVKLIENHKLVRECIPTQFLSDKSVWAALLQDMPITATIRTLGKLSSIGVLAPMSDAARLVVERLGNVELLKKGRVHPLSVLIAQKIYAQGRGDKGALNWTPVPQVIDALDDAFYTAFEAVEPTGKHWMLGIDVSASMSTSISGAPLSCCEAATALALVTVHTEPWTFAGRFNTGIESCPFSKKTRMDDALQYTRNINGGGTDCSLPMLFALRNKMPVDAFVVLTDSETWAGCVHPPQALEQYRNAMGINAKLIVCSMVANPFTIADPNDPGMLDCIGFDTVVPQVMAEFVR